MARRFLAELLVEKVNAKEDIVLIGGGGHAKVVLSILRKLDRYVIKGFTDPRRSESLLGLPYLGSDEQLQRLVAESPRMNAAFAVGQIGLGKARQQIYQRLSDVAFRRPAIISPNAVVNEEVAIGDAVVVMDGAVINPGATVGIGVIVNTHSTVEHDVTLGDWVHVAPGATISGGVTVGSRSMIGAGATIIEGRTIAADTIIGAGSTVIRDILEPGVYVGTPARRIK
jgi:sugar O-acyltransferase (sialic acid O-acetyltransferase NeuD family)